MPWIASLFASNCFGSDSYTEKYFQIKLKMKIPSHGQELLKQKLRN